MGVYRRGNTWWVRLGFQGKKIRRRGGRTRKEAEKVLVELRRQLEYGEEEDTKLEPATFSQFADTYMEYSTTNKARRSFERDMYAVSKHLVPFFKQTPLTAIRPSDVEKYKQHRRSLAAPATVNKELTILKAMLNKAVEWGNLRSSPASRISKLTDPVKPPKFLTAEECSKLIKACRCSRTKGLYPFVATALYAGLRKDELFHLEWTDVDLEHGMLQIVNKAEWHTKTYEPRIIPMPRKLREILREHPRHPDSLYVFYNRDGTRFHDIRWSFDKAVKCAGLDHLTFHSLRHTYASLLVMNGKDLPTVQRLLGHRDIKTTMRYAHLAPDHLRQAVEDMDFDREDR